MIGWEMLHITNPLWATSFLMVLVLFFGLARSRQLTIALTLTEAEYRGVFNVATEAIWLQHILTEFGIQYCR